MNQKQFLSWIKNNSQWIISKLENLEDYENNYDDLKEGDIILKSMRFKRGVNPNGFNISLIDRVFNNKNNKRVKMVSYFTHSGYLKKDEKKFSKDQLIMYQPLMGQPYKELKSLYLLEMQIQKEYVVGNISEIIKKPFLNWSKETPWKKSSSDQ